MLGASPKGKDCDSRTKTPLYLGFFAENRKFRQGNSPLKSRFALTIDQTQPWAVYLREETKLMKTLLKGRSAVARLAATALFAVAGLCTTAHAQTPIDWNGLDSQQKVIQCSAGVDQVVEAGIGTVEFHGAITNGYTSDPPPIFMWINQTTGQPETSGEDNAQTAPRHDTTYRLIVLDVSTMNWGDATFHVTVTDTTAPQIWVNGPPTVYVNACTNYSEAGWGVFDNEDETSVPVTVSGQVNVNQVGEYTLTYTATDSHNNSASVSRTVYVIYSWTGFQAPVDPNGKSIFKLNSTIPLKFQLTDGCCNITNLAARLYLAKVSNSIVGTEIEATASGNSDTGNVFRYAGGGYMYNLSTKGLSAGTWQLRVDLGDGAIHAYTISIK